MTTDAKKSVKTPKTAILVSPLESSFEVSIPGVNFWGEDTFKFSISSRGDVTINDNTFNSKEQAVKVLEAMSAFLKK